jgi:hypothetical protein
MSGRREERQGPGEPGEDPRDVAEREVRRRSRPDVTLQPPPRPAVDLSRNAPSTPRNTRTSVSPASVAILAVLALAAAGVFVALPRWMAGRPRPSASDAAPSAPAPVTEAPAANATPPATPDPIAALPDEPEQEAPPVARPAAPPRLPGPPPAPDPGSAEWTRAMSEGLAALDRGALDEAQAAFARAEAARPGAPSTADAVKRIEEARKAEGLTAARARAEAAEGREDWKGAAAEYEAALKLDPWVAFALAGRARTAPRAALDEALEGYLHRPERLSAENVAREAERALARAEEVEKPGPRLQQQRAGLERILKDARTTVDVPLVSDGVTEVAVLRVGTLGAFRKKEIPLRPGSYVVVGKRRGYRDTRKTLVVAPGARPAPLDVRCEEAL